MHAGVAGASAPLTEKALRNLHAARTMPVRTPPSEVVLADSDLRIPAGIRGLERRKVTSEGGVLTTFVEVYEAERFPIDDSRITPLDALKALLGEHGMTASDLGRLLGNRTLGAAILSGRRSLSKAHIKKLAEYFKVEPGLFL